MSKSFSEHERSVIKEKLIQSCEECWSRYGYKKTSVGEICGMSGISAGAFYAFYPSKEMLFVAARQYRPKMLELDIDYALHDVPGLAGDWAKSAKIGYRLGVVEFALPAGHRPAAAYEASGGSYSSPISLNAAMPRRALRSTPSRYGKRTIPLNSRAVEAILHLKAQQVAGCPCVLTTQTGKHLSYRNLLATIEKACEAAGVEHRGLHALRHC